MKDQNNQQIEESNGKQDEIDALNKHMSLITTQNYELSSELQRFLQTDEVVKTKLNRRQTVDEIRNKVDTAIKRSQREVQSRRSPVRQEATEQRTTTTVYRHQSGERQSSGHRGGVSAASYNAPRTGSPLRSKSPPRR